MYAVSGADTTVCAQFVMPYSAYGIQQNYHTTEYFNLGTCASQGIESTCITPVALILT